MSCGNPPGKRKFLSNPNMNLREIVQSPQAEIVNEFTLQGGIVLKNKHLLENRTYWHKFIVHNAQNLSRDAILKLVLDHVEPADLIPVNFLKESADSVSFLARNCARAIETLCQDKLTVRNPYNRHKPFKLWIVLHFATTDHVKIDVSKNVLKVMRKRNDPKTCTLNLRDFNNDPELIEFCVLSQPKLLAYVLHFAKMFACKTVILSNNAIKTLAPTASVWGTTITSLDLRNNQIQDLSELEALSRLEIIELWLEGNPLCDHYDEYTYIQRVKKHCPNIKRLDGILLQHNGFPSFRRNFVCNMSGRDLVNQFLEYYFTVYDSKNRAMLANLYHESALFSLTAEYIPLQTSSSTTHMKNYRSHARNVFALADVSKSDQNLFQGGKTVAEFLGQLPLSEHDPYSFSVDLMYYSDISAVIVVTGVFRELPENILDAERMMGFHRSFVLSCINGEYCIVNEQMHVYNALTSQQERAFRHERPIRAQMLPQAKTEIHKKQLIEAFTLITNMTAAWAERCLEDGQYDLKNAIMYFVDMYTADKIPNDGFQS